jgi:hypothetical protein
MLPSNHKISAEHSQFSSFAPSTFQQVKATFELQILATLQHTRVICSLITQIELLDWCHNIQHAAAAPDRQAATVDYISAAGQNPGHRPCHSGAGCASLRYPILLSHPRVKSASKAIIPILP